MVADPKAVAVSTPRDQDASEPPARCARVRQLMALGVTGLVLLLCWLPSSAAHHVPMHGMDKLLHAAAFFAIALAWRFAGLGIVQVLGLGIGLAVLTEFGQWLLQSGRTGDVKDVVADVAGLVAGLACVRLGASLRESSRTG